MLGMLSVDGGALGSSPASAVGRTTSRIRVLLSGAITPLTGPPFQPLAGLGSADQPISTLIPGPSAPVRQSTMCDIAGLARAVAAGGRARWSTGCRHSPLARRNKGSCSSPIGAVGKAIGGSVCAACVAREQRVLPLGAPQLPDAEPDHRRDRGGDDDRRDERQAADHC